MFSLSHNFLCFSIVLLSPFLKNLFLNCLQFFLFTPSISFFVNPHSLSPFTISLSAWPLFLLLCFSHPVSLFLLPFVHSFSLSHFFFFLFCWYLRKYLTVSLQIIFLFLFYIYSACLNIFLSPIFSVLFFWSSNFLKIFPYFNCLQFLFLLSATISLSVPSSSLPILISLFLFFFSSSYSSSSSSCLWISWAFLTLYLSSPSSLSYFMFCWSVRKKLFFSTELFL